MSFRDARVLPRWAAGAVALMALTACAGPAPEVVPAPGQAEKSCGEVVLAKNAWAGYEANLAVIGRLLTRELGCTVRTAEAAEADSWKALAAGKVDAILENWAHDAEKKKYIDTERVAVEAGLTGNKGVLGWFVPPWMAEQYPDVTDYRKLNEYASLFATEESQGKGQLLLGDPSYVTNDKALVRNLDLDYTVVYAGSEDALISAFRTAERDREPLLGYFYSPQWFLSEVELEHVRLPAYTPGCDADPKTVRCDYQPFDLDKIMNREFAYSGSPAAELISKFTWTDADQNGVARDLTEGELSPAQAADRWLAANPDVWQEWMPAGWTPASPAATSTASPLPSSTG